jgi:adenylosuccinate synthase
VKREAIVVAGLAYGDEGKGSVVDFLVRQRQAGLVVRYNGGAQAAHNVVTKDGKEHTFSQFGSGTLAGASTHLSRFVMVNPLTMMKEEEHLRELGIPNAFARITVEDDALITTPFQKVLNQFEAQASGEYRSCGMGIGQTRSDYLEYGTRVLFAGDLRDVWLTKGKLSFIQQECLRKARVLKDKLAHTPENAKLWLWLNGGIGPVNWCCQKYSEWSVSVVPRDYLGKLLASHSCIVFEGAQGVLLDEKWGEKDYNTWTDCTFKNANILLDESGHTDERTYVGVIRAYLTRHGAGPFRTEDKALKFEEKHNDTGKYQGEFRFGHLDFSLLQFALKLAPVDMIAMNHLDQVEWPKEYVSLAEKNLQAPVGIKGFGPTAEDKEVTSLREVRRA